MQRFHFGKIPIWELNRLKRFALLTQLVEYHTFNVRGEGSSPSGRTFIVLTLSSVGRAAFIVITLVAVTSKECCRLELLQF